MRDVEFWLDSVMEFLQLAIIFLGFIVLTITLPIWILPFLVYKKLRWRI